MQELFADLGLPVELGTAIAIYSVLVLSVLWLAMVIWTYRDMRSRSRDPIGQLGAALLVLILNLPGLLIYFLLRPRETLSEAYERSLEEEALLQEIEEKPTCPGCGQRVQEAWQACPQCFTRLKKPCVHCRQMLELSWAICPHCATPQPGYVEPSPPSGIQARSDTIATTVGSGHVRQRSNRSPAPVEFTDAS